MKTVLENKNSSLSFDRDRQSKTKLRTADDAGFTPAEIIIGVILVAILATGVTIKAVQLMESARNGAAQKTLRTALAAAGAVYGDVLIDGSSNYAGTIATSQKIHDGGTFTTAFPDPGSHKTASVLAESKLREKEPGLVFQDKFTFAKLEDAAPDASTVWVQVNTVEMASPAVSLGATNPNGHNNSGVSIEAMTTSGTDHVKIRAGQLVRLGIISASGASFCVVSVASSSNTRVTGEGYQSVSDTDTQRGAGADCGAEKAGAHDTDDDAEAWAQMPNTPGTDRTLSAKPSVLDDSAAAADAQHYKE